MKKLKKVLSLLLIGVIAVSSLVCGSVSAGAASLEYFCYYDETGKGLHFDGTDVGSPCFVISGVTGAEEGNYFANIIYSDTFDLVISAKVLSGDDEITFEYRYHEKSRSGEMNVYDSKGNYKYGFMYDSYYHNVEDSKYREQVFVMNTRSDEDKRLVKLISEATTCRMTVGIVDTNPVNKDYFVNYQNVGKDVEVPLVNKTGRPYPYSEPKPAEEETADTSKTDTAAAAVTEPAVKSISGVTAAKLADAVYTGKAIKPAVALTDGNKKLTVGTDYTLTYKNNKNVGKASAVITGKGNYTGTKTVTFNIVPKSTSLSAKRSGNKIKLSWKAVSGITKYQVQYSADGGNTFKSAGKFASSKTSASLKLGTGSYVFRIRTYKTVDGKNYYSAWSKNVSVK